MNRALTLSRIRCGQVISQFKELVNAKSTGMPNLCSIGDWISPTMHHVAALLELVDACREADVALLGSLPHGPQWSDQDLRCLEVPYDLSSLKQENVPPDISWQFLVEDEARCEGMLEVS